MGKNILVKTIAVFCCKFFLNYIIFNHLFTKHSRKESTMNIKVASVVLITSFSPLLFASQPLNDDPLKEAVLSSKATAQPAVSASDEARLSAAKAKLVSYLTFTQEISRDDQALAQNMSAILVFLKRSEKLDENPAAQTKFHEEGMQLKQKHDELVAAINTKNNQRDALRNTV
jgi:membrane-anchored protein YejM (alkaline phosphatase superfamily)